MTGRVLGALLALFVISVLFSGCAGTNPYQYRAGYTEGPSWEAGKVTLVNETITGIGCEYGSPDQPDSWSLTRRVAGQNAKVAIAQYYETVVKATKNSSSSITDVTLNGIRQIDSEVFEDGQFCVKMSGYLRSIVRR